MTDALTMSKIPTLPRCIAFYHHGQTVVVWYPTSGRWQIGNSSAGTVLSCHPHTVTTLPNTPRSTVHTAHLLQRTTSEPVMDDKEGRNTNSGTQAPKASGNRRKMAHDELNARKISSKLLQYNLLGAHEHIDGPAAHGLAANMDETAAMKSTLFFHLYIWATSEDNTRCRDFHLPDTLIVEHGLVHSWLFTDRRGVIRRKTKARTQEPLEILAAFAKDPHSSRTGAIVANHIVPGPSSVGGVITPLTLGKLKSLLGTSGPPRSLPDGLIQGVVSPYMGRHDVNSIHTTHYSFVSSNSISASGPSWTRKAPFTTNLKHPDAKRSPSPMLSRTPGTLTQLQVEDGNPINSCCRVETSVRSKRGTLTKKDATPEMINTDEFLAEASSAENTDTPIKLETRLQSACRGIAAHLERVAPSYYRVLDMKLHFTHDGNGKLYFLWCSDIRVIANARESENSQGLVSGNLHGQVSSLRNLFGDAGNRSIYTKPRKLHFADSQNDFAGGGDYASDDGRHATKFPPPRPASQNDGERARQHGHKINAPKRSNQWHRSPGVLPSYKRAPRSRLSIERPGAQPWRLDDEYNGEVSSSPTRVRIQARHSRVASPLPQIRTPEPNIPWKG